MEPKRVYLSPSPLSMLTDIQDAEFDIHRECPENDQNIDKKKTKEYLTTYNLRRKAPMPFEIRLIFATQRYFHWLIWLKWWRNSWHRIWARCVSPAAKFSFSSSKNLSRFCTFSMHCSARPWISAPLLLICKRIREFWAMESGFAPFLVRSLYISVPGKLSDVDEILMLLPLLPNLIRRLRASGKNSNLCSFKKTVWNFNGWLVRR